MGQESTCGLATSCISQLNNQGQQSSHLKFQPGQDLSQAHSHGKYFDVCTYVRMVMRQFLQILQVLFLLTGQMTHPEFISVHHSPTLPPCFLLLPTLIGLQSRINLFLFYKRLNQKLM